MRIDAAERFAFSFMYGNTQFCTKTQSIFRTKKVDSSFLVRLHWSIQNSSCTFNVPMLFQLLLNCSMAYELLGRANNLWILQVPRSVLCPLDRSVSHSLRAGQSTVIFLLILFHSLLQKQQKMLYSLFQSKLDAENVWIFSPFIQIIVSRLRNGDV